LFVYFQTFDDSSQTDNEENHTPVDDFRIPQRKSSPKKRKRQLSQLSNVVGQLKEMTQASCLQLEENEFEVFGKHVAVQLKSLPLLTAIDLQENIQVLINKVRREHVQSNKIIYSNIEEIELIPSATQGGGDFL
jgi:hypothetical protein